MNKDQAHKQKPEGQHKDTVIWSFLNAQERTKIHNVKTIEEISKILEMSKSHNLSVENQKIIDEHIKIVTGIDANAKQLKKDLNGTLDDSIFQRQDPFEALKNIDEPRIIHSIVDILLRDGEIKSYMALAWNNTQDLTDEKIKWLKTMLENTESKTLKTNAGDLLNILENLKKPDSSQMDILKNRLKKSEEKVREQIDGKINLDSILKDNPSFAKELTEEIEENIFDVTFFEEEIGDEEGEEYQYTVINDFYTKFLANGNYKKSVVMEKEELEALIKDITECLTETNIEDKCPSLEVFLNKLIEIDKEAITVEREVAANPEPVKKPISMEDCRVMIAETAKKDPDVITFGQGLKAGATLLFWKTLCSVGSFFIGGGVSAAIYFSQELLKGGKSPSLKLKDPGWILGPKDEKKK